MGQSTKKSNEGSNFYDDSDFLKIGELWSTYFVVFKKHSGRATSHQNFLFLSSKTKKLLSDQILNFGPDFCKIAELWSTYFGLVGKRLLESAQEVLQEAQSLLAKVQKPKSYEGPNFHENYNFLKISELWSAYFNVFEKPSGRATSHQNFVG